MRRILTLLRLLQTLLLSLPLIPRLRTQNIMHILNILVPPDRIMNTLPPERLQRIVDIRDGNPPAVKDIAQERLVGEIVARRRGRVELRADLVVGSLGGIDDLETAVGDAQARGGRGTDRLGGFGVGVLAGEGAIGRDPGRLLAQNGKWVGKGPHCIGKVIIPILRIMRLLQRIAHTSMTRSKHPLPGPRQLRRIELEIHQLVHILEGDHVAIQLDDALILDQREGGQFAPAVVEPHVVGVVL